MKSEGIRNIDLSDLKYADSLGYKVKMLGISQLNGKEIKNASALANPESLDFYRNLKI